MHTIKCVFLVLLCSECSIGISSSAIHSTYVSQTPTLGMVARRGVNNLKMETKTLSSKQPFLNMRGGFTDGFDVDNDEDDEDFDDIDFGGGGQGNKMIAGINDMWSKTPPMTQIYVGLSVAITLACWGLNKNQWPDILNLKWSSVLSGQLWRPITAFLFYGPFGLNYILTIQFVWTYMAQLEKLNYNKPQEFFMMLVFGAFSLLGGYAALGFNTKFLGHNLSTYLVYIWARVFEGTDVNVMDLFLLRAELLPWFFCAQTWLLEGEMPFADLMGIGVGHLYQYLASKNILKAPAFVETIFDSPNMKKKYAMFKADFEV